MNVPQPTTAARPRAKMRTWFRGDVFLAGVWAISNSFDFRI
jgi:hypothetical protein